MNFDKINVPIGVTNHTKLDLSCEHITTMQFGILQPVYYRHMIKGEKLNASVFSTIRPAPLAVPVYGNIRLNLRAFFVPYRLCMPQFDSFYTDVIGSNYSNSSLVQSVPYFTNSQFMAFVTGSTLILVTPGTSTNYDFEYGGNFYLLTMLGRRLFKMMHSLGYRFNPSDKDNTQYSALALLAYAKIYIDWYANQNYLDSATILHIKQLLAYNSPTTPLQLSSTDLFYIFDVLNVAIYQSDYFTAAYDNPVSPNAPSTPIAWLDPTVNNGAYIYADSNVFGYNTPQMMAPNNVSGDLPVGTQYLHDALQRLTEYSRRHQLSGCLEIDRYLSQFGMGTDSTKMMRSLYIGSNVSDINVAEVMSTANTAGAGNVSNLGDYSGQGFGQTKKDWEFKTDEFGIFIVMASIMPSAGNWQGVDRHNLDLTRYDLFNPELDGLSTQAIARREVYLSKNGSFGSQLDYDGTFGFTGRYGHYKRPLNYVTGDLEWPSVMVGGSAWHLQRVFNDSSFSGSAANISHSIGFTRMDDFQQYDRIFQYTSSNVDKFYCDFNFNVSALAPCKPLFDIYDFEDDNKKIKLAVNGSKLD